MNNGASGIRVGVPVCPQLRDGIANSGGLKLGTSLNFVGLQTRGSLDFARKTAVESLHRHACTLQSGAPNLQMLASELAKVGGNAGFLVRS